jgi:hypothetical protein
MQLHMPLIANTAWTTRSLVVAAGYVLGLVLGTALLMAAFSAGDDGRVNGPTGTRITVSEQTMQAAADKALVSPSQALLAGITDLNDKRGVN